MLEYLQFNGYRGRGVSYEPQEEIKYDREERDEGNNGFGLRAFLCGSDRR